MGNKVSRDALEGRAAVITGANNRIGLAVTIKLLEYGMTVIGIDGETDNLDELKENESFSQLVHVIQADITDEEEMLDAFQWIIDNTETVDVFINSAEIIEPCSILGGNKEQWEKMANMNILGLTACTVEMIRTMKDQKISLGLIVVINNITGCVVANSSTYHFYSATKHATARLTLHLKDELEFTMTPIKVTSITIGPNEFFPCEEGYVNELFETHDSLQMDSITSAIDYVIHTPSHMQLRDIHILPVKK